MEIDLTIEKVKELNVLLERSIVLIDELSGSSKKATAGTVTLTNRDDFNCPLVIRNIDEALGQKFFQNLR